MYIRALCTLLLPAVKETAPEMDPNIALEALSALTGCTVKPCPAGGSPDSLELRGGCQKSIPLLTIENLISTIFCNETLGPTGGSVAGAKGGFEQCSSTQNNIPPLKNDMDINREEFLSSGDDKDFRGTKDQSKCFRGDESYTRPWGWYRFALKVKDKYPEGNTWLGSPGWRNNSSPGEWPVSFHGTSLEGAIGITEGYYEQGKRAAYGHGIYSTPNIKIAEEYAKKFTSETDKKTYKVVMQNRINPKKRTLTKKKDYWLIKIDRNATAEEVKKISRESIRPYGILIKEV